MKVVHINSNRGGGAALCAFRISKALSNLGVESSVIVSSGKSTEHYQVASRDHERWNSNRWARRIKHLLIKMHLWRGYEQMQYDLYRIVNRNKIDEFVHIPFSKFKTLSQHPLIKEADIIHLHWVSGFIDYPSFFREINKPVIWTMHDKYPAMGLMHYSSRFFPLPEPLKKIDSQCRKIKRQAMLQCKEIQLVAISEYMQLLCNESDVLKGFPVNLIHNGVDIEVFKNKSQQKARELFGLPFEDKVGIKTIIFMICGCDISDTNKGLVRVVNALNMLQESNYMLVCVGPEPTNKQHSIFPISYLGTVTDQEQLALIYTACDYYILASYEETFAQTPLEAMACGRPVISTPCSGAKDLIRPFNGIICDGYLPNELLGGIKKAMQTKYQENVIRDYIVQNYSYDVIGKKYLNLYNNLLSQ